MSACTVLYIWLLKNAQWIGSLWILLAWNWFWDNWYWFLSKSLIFCFLINTEKSIVSSNMLFRETSMGCHHDLSYLPVSVFISRSSFSPMHSKHLMPQAIYALVHDCIMVVWKVLISGLLDMNNEYSLVKKNKLWSLTCTYHISFYL